jgi:hypothetical protein
VMAYWRGAGALPVDAQGYVKDGQGTRARQLRPDDVAEIAALERQIASLTEKRRAILDRAAKSGERVFVGTVPF